MRLEGDVRADAWECICGGKERDSGLADRYLKNNQLSGSLPTEIGQLTSLRDLYDAAQAGCHLVQCLETEGAAGG